MSDIIPEGILYGNLGAGSGTTNYNDLDNKPQINSVTLQGNKTASELGLVGTSDIPVTSVNGETGAVVLNGTEIEFSTGVSLNEKIIAVEQEIPVIAYPVTSVNGETGAVVLDGTDIEYSSGVSVNSQIDTLMNYIPVYGNTASGAIATFDTSLALPLQDCTIAINGTDLTGANIRVVGSNLFDEAMEIGSINTSTGANEPASNVMRSTNYTQITPNTTYKITQGSYVYAFFYYDASKTFISYASGSSTFTTPANACYMRFRLFSAYGTTYNNDIAILYPSSLNSYVAYNANSTTTAISWNDLGTVSEGFLDVTTGKLTVVNGSMGAGEYQITPIPINQISGANNVFCDTGNTSVVYACSLKDYIDSQ